MHPTWQLLERHRDDLDREAVLWVDPPQNHDLIKPEDGLLTLDRSLFRQVRARCVTPEDTWPEGVSRLVLFYPKAKERLEWWLKQIEKHAPGVELHVVGENNGGIKSLAKRVKSFADVTKLDTARHCALFHYRPFAEVPQQNDGWRQFDHNGLTIQALPGVFSQQKLDRGTALLLDTLPELKGFVLEFGCGSGVLAAEVLRRSPEASLTAVDIDWLAVQSTQRTLTEAGFGERSRVLWSDGLAEVPQQRFDVIITNPPFHAGIKTHYEPSERFFAECDKWLRPGGELWWVANDFLDYQSTLGAGFRFCDEKRHHQGFRIFRARR